MKSKALRCAHSSGFPYSGKGLTMIFPGVKFKCTDLAYGGYEEFCYVDTRTGGLQEVGCQTFINW